MDSCAVGDEAIQALAGPVVSGFIILWSKKNASEEKSLTILVLADSSRQAYLRYHVTDY